MMELETQAGGKRQIETVAELEDALAALGGAHDRVAVLSAKPDHCIQTELLPEGYVVERMEGTIESLRGAVRAGHAHDHLPGRFSHDEMVAMFRAYFTGADMPAGISFAHTGTPQVPRNPWPGRMAFFIAALGLALLFLGFGMGHG